MFYVCGVYVCVIQPFNYGCQSPINVCLFAIPFSFMNRFWYFWHKCYWKSKQSKAALFSQLK